MRLEFIGQPGPWRDLERFVEAVRFKRPSISEWDLMTIVHETNARLRPRNARQQLILFGMDIMSDALADIEGWRFIDSTWKNLVPLFPLYTGELISEQDGAKLMSAISTRSFSLINRASLVTPPGLSRTYVWTRENEFIQDVVDQDVDRIRTNPRLRSLFRPVDFADGPQIIQSFSLPVEHTTVTKTISESEAFALEMNIGYEQ